MFRFAAGLFALVTLSVGLASGQAPLLLQHPTLSATQIAFVYAGDLWTVPRGGGAAQRLTYHPSADWVMGWTRDGKQVLFASTRNSYENFNRLFTISRDGGFPAESP